ncbi:hypothetical protein QBC47DRAFT_399659 [Echria macrotheca]|uniref:Uncharacterized protein n=1 Tax=Echria macrotheca TaxID=438768 RepID=A0AAJ0FD77_9PEZI|nr:hypothetical protein QBC47DRAFT_399659 [Echria macrotheca]
MHRFRGLKLRALPAASGSQPDTTTEDLDLLNLFWPGLEWKDVSGNQHHDLFLEYVSSVIADLEKQFSLPSALTRLVIQSVVQSKDALRSQIEQTIRSHYQPPALGDTAQHAMQTIARLWTMLDIQIGPPTPRYQPPGPLVWLPQEPVSAVTGRFFAQKAQSERGLEVSGSIDPKLTAARLVADHNIRILWTCNLAEHLSLNWARKKRTLKVFEHKIWVHRHLTSPERSPLPADVLEELMVTYNLLFPLFDRETESLLDKHGMIESFYSLGTCGKPPSPNWSDYRYWHNQLHELSEVLNEPPRGIQQLWRTSRKNPNLLNLVLFWISGVMVAILTIVSSVCGVLSVQYAIQSRDIGLWQFELALAQVCADADLADKLPKYCSNKTTQ